MEMVVAVGRVAVEEAVVHEAVAAVETRETREVLAALTEVMVPHPLTTTHYLLLTTAAPATASSRARRTSGAP